MAIRIGKTAGPEKVSESPELREQVSGRLARWAPNLPAPVEPGEQTS